MVDLPRHNDWPLTREEMRRLESRKATATVPDELASIGGNALPSKKVALIDRALAGRIDAPAVLQGYVPPWVEVSFSPKRRDRSLKPVVTHRGEKLDPFVIHRPDDRRAYDDARYPWICVCRITRPDGGGGSGVLIGPRHVLTASHIVQWNTNVAERIEVHFAGNAARATAFTLAAYAYTQIEGLPTSSTVDEDYAVITLTERLGDRFGFFGSKLYDSGWDDEAVWQTIGYAEDVAQFRFPTFQGNVSLDEDELDLGSGRAMETSADVMHGQSGAPMFGVWAGDPVAYAVAVISAGRGDENVCSGGEDLNRIVRHARTQDP